jgi:transposase InsO family protein
MIQMLRLILCQIARTLRSGAEVHAENLALRHQVEILKRKAPKRVRLTNSDRFLFTWLFRLWPNVAGAVAIVRPKTLVRWHRQGFRAYWCWKSRPRGGRPKVPKEMRDLIRQMSIQNPLWGAPRVHGELLKLGFDVSQATVSKYMVRRPTGPEQGWRTFLRNHMRCTAAVDSLVVPTVTFGTLYVLVVLSHERRRVIHFGVTAHPTAEWTARQITEAFPWDQAPRFLIRDNHRSYGRIFRKRIAVMAIQDVPIALRSPWQNGYVERLIGSIRRECLDHVIALNERHLHRILRSYFAYYNQARTHLALNKDTPIPRRRSSPFGGRIVAFPEVGGLHHRYERLAA